MKALFVLSAHIVIILNACRHRLPLTADRHVAITLDELGFPGVLPALSGAPWRQYCCPAWSVPFRATLM